MSRLKRLVGEARTRYPGIKIECELEQEYRVWYVYNMVYPGDKGKSVKKKDGYIFKVPYELNVTIEEILEKLFNDDRTG